MNDGILLMKSEKVIREAISNTLILCEQHKLQFPSEEQREKMYEIAREYFREIIINGEINSIPFPDEKQFAFFFFNNKTRASIKTIRFVIVDNHVSLIIKKFFRNLKYDNTPYSRSSSFDYFDTIEEYSDQKLSNVEDVNKYLLSTQPGIDSPEDDDNLKQFIFFNRFKLREYTHERKRSKNRYYYQRPCDLKISIEPLIDLEVSKDVAYTNTYKLNFDIKDTFKAFFDSPDYEQRIKAKYIIDFYNHLLPHSMKGKGNAKNKNVITRSLLGFVIGAAQANGWNYFIQLAPDYLHSKRCENIRFDKILDLRASTMHFEIQPHFDIRLQKLEKVMHNTSLKARYDILSRKLLSNSEIMVDGDELIAIQGSQLAKKGLKWASPLWSGLRAMQNGIPAYLEYRANHPKSTA